MSTKWATVPLFLAALPGVLLAQGETPPPPQDLQSVVKTLRLKEVFGVSHPDQVVDFDLGKKMSEGSLYMIGPDGNEVPCQIIASGNKVAVRTDLPANAEKIFKLCKGRSPAPYAQAIQVTSKDGKHEITNGLIGIRVAGGKGDGAGAPAPIQGIQLRDGKWTATGPNYLSQSAGDVKVKFLEKGPLKVVIQVVYSVGGGVYSSTLEMDAGQPSVLIEEVAENVELSWDLNIRENVNPSRVRFRPQPGDSTWPENESGLGGTYRLAVWDPWIRDGGWHIQAIGGQNVVGMYTGRCSRAFMAGSSGMRLVGDGGGPRLRMEMSHGNNYGKDLRNHRFSWGLYVGTPADLASQEAPLGISKQKNIHAGIGLNKLHRLKVDFPDPPGGYGALFIEPEALRKIIHRVRTDSSYFTLLGSETTYARPMFAMWQDTSGGKVREAIGVLRKVSQEVVHALVNLCGVLERPNYYERWQAIMEPFLLADQILFSDLATREEKEFAKTFLVLFATLVTDDDYTAGQENTGLNYGTMGQALHIPEFRTLVGVYMSTHPEFKHLVKNAVPTVERLIQLQINEHGAHIASTHYMEPAFSPMGALMLLLKRRGMEDFFKNDKKRGNRITKLSEFFMNTLTPLDPRYGNVRKYIAVGDSPTESADRYAILATGFADSNKDLSARLMGAWEQNGSPYYAFFGTGVLKIDPSLPSKDPKLGCASFPGYYSVLRFGWGTKNETAVWSVNGDWFFDHRHSGEGGEVIAYALGAPLSLDFGSQYNPRKEEADTHSVAQPGGNGTLVPKLDIYKAGGKSAFLRTTGDLPGRDVNWTRAVSLVMAADDRPVIGIQDGFSKPGEQAVHLNLMAEGPVETPSGPRSPGGSFDLAAGVNRLGFTGQTWPAHSSKGIDFDVYVVCDKPQKGEIGQWGHSGAPGREQQQFQKANNRGFEEKQYILKVRGELIRMFIVPWFKDRKPGSIHVSQGGGEVTVSVEGRTARFGLDGKAD